MHRAPFQPHPHSSCGWVFLWSPVRKQQSFKQPYIIKSFISTRVCARPSAREPCQSWPGLVNKDLEWINCPPAYHSWVLVPRYMKRGRKYLYWSWKRSWVKVCWEFKTALKKLGKKVFEFENLKFVQQLYKLLHVINTCKCTVWYL